MSAAARAPASVRRAHVTPSALARLDTRPGRAVLQLGAVALFFALWQGGVRVGWVSDFLVGAPAGIWRAFLRALRDGTLLTDIAVTVYEAVLGFAIGTVAGSLCGLALWYSAFVARVTEPFIVALNSVPKIALAPIVILWFGTGLVSKVALAVSLTALVALIAAYQGAKDTDRDLQSLLVSMGATKHQVFWSVIVPASLPAMIATFRINIGFGLVGAVVGEFISSRRGLGHLIYEASGLYDLNTVWMGLFMLMLVGFVLYYAIEAIEAHLLPWKQETTRAVVQA